MIDVSKITDYLYVSSCVRHEHAEELKILKFDLIISMIGFMKPHPVYYQDPFKILWIRTHDSFFAPIPVSKLLKGVEAAVPVIKSGGKVLTFCMQGRHRSVAMASAILIAMGHTSQEAAELLVGGRKIADPRRWYIKMQIHKFEKLWNQHLLQV
jgi:hypothetical protein